MTNPHAPFNALALAFYFTFVNRRHFFESLAIHLAVSLVRAKFKHIYLPTMSHLLYATFNYTHLLHWNPCIIQ